MKLLYQKASNFIKSASGVTLTGNVTIDTLYNNHVFGAFATTNAIWFNKESCYDDVLFTTTLKYASTNADHSIGVALRCKTDNNSSENIVFQIKPTQLVYFRNGAQIATVNHSLSLEGKIVSIAVKRTDDTYSLFVNGTQLYTSSSLNYKQNTTLAVSGHNVSVKIYSAKYTTNRDNIKFAIIGDSISNNSYLTPASTLKGVLRSRGGDVGEFSGDASVVKDALDCMSEILVVKPQYAIIMFGHNDTLFNTGRLLSDLTTLKNNLVAGGITPIFCTVPYSGSININTPNDIIRTAFFGTDLHIDLQGVIAGGDTTDNLHPNAGGVIKLADVIYPYISELP